MKARVVALVALAAAVTLTAVAAAAGPDSAKQRAAILVERQTVTEDGVRFSFRVPTKAGWDRVNSITTGKSPGGPISLNKSIMGPQGAEAIIYWTSFPHGDHADPCLRLLGGSVGRSAADLAAAVSRAPGTKLVKGPSDVTLGRHPAKHVVLTVRKNVGCDPGFFYTWRAVFGGAFWQTTDIGDTIRVWIVPLDGTRLFIAAATTAEVNLLTARLTKDVQRIVESFRLEPRAFRHRAVR